MDDNLALLRAMAHPLRLRILSLVTGQAMSAAELARALGCTQANASYHLRVLATVGQVETAERVTIRGGQAVRFRYAGRVEDRRGRPLAVEDHLLFASALGRELERRTALRDRRAMGAATDAELWVRPEHWEEFRAAVMDASRRLHSRARAAGAPGTVKTSTTISLFRMLTR